MYCEDQNLIHSLGLCFDLWGRYTLREQSSNRYIVQCTRYERLRTNCSELKLNKNKQTYLIKLKMIGVGHGRSYYRAWCLGGLKPPPPEFSRLH